MQLADSDCRTTINGFPIEVYINGEYLGVYNFNHDRYSYKSYGYDYNKYPNMLVYEINSNSNTSAGAFYRYGDNAESSANVSELEYYKRDFNLIYGNRTTDSDSYSEIKTLVEWVSVAEQDLFREMISEHFNKEYLFRYLLTVLMIGAVDSLGKNMKIMTIDGQVWYPTFYDLDTVLGIDNSGYLTIQPDVEIESGSYNTSNSNLWSKVWNYFNTELKEEWAKMRQGSFTLDNLMNYVYGEQISKIPAKMYNDDAQVKYLDFGSLYTYCCHGSKEHQIRRWLRERIAYVDSMLGYFTSQEDQVTIRMNKTGQVSFEVTPYIPLYFSVKWSNATGGTQTFKLKRGETKTFNYSSTTSTDQEVIIYHAKYIKRLDNLSNLNPSSCILSNAVKLTNVEIHSSELYNINVTNNKFLRSINLENCTALGTVTATGSSLNLSNCKYLRYCNVYNTHLTEVQLNTSGGSLTEIYYPQSIQSINLVKQRLLELIGLPYGEGGKEIPTSLYTISIQECPSITKLNTSSDPTIASSFASMVYVNNLTIRNSLDLASLKFDGFHRLQNVTIENMYNLEEVGFNNLLPVGETSTIKYIGMSNCPKLGTIELNCTSNDYEITFADDAILNFGGLFKLNSITSNCVLKGIKTIVVPINLESMFFTNEYGSGYSTIENIWVSSQCNVDTQATTPIVTHVDSTYSGIDFLGMNLKNIDLGALVNIPKAINFKLSPTTVNPHFNLNRDGETYKYLQPVGTLDLSNYTESLAKFFDGVDLDKLEIICNNNLPQTDLSYCFYNSSFSTNDAINKLLTKVSSITNLNYCFYRTTINSVDILGDINMGESSSMNYTFAECPNIKELNSVVIPSNVTSVEGMFNKCPLTVINNMIVNVRGSISGLFKGCNKLTTINTLRIPNVTDVSGTFEGCTSLSSLSGFELPSSCTNVSNLFNGCYMLTELGMNFSSNITAGDNWYPPNLETLHDTTISNDYVKLTNCTTLKTLNGVNISGGDLSDLFNGCTNLVNINNCTFNATTSLARAFKGCSKITINPITTIVNTVTDISEMYSGCTGITDISGMTFGSGITNATDCIKDVPLVYANDITIKSFINRVPTIMFTNCSNLVSAKNLKLIAPSLPTVALDNMFRMCTNLVDVNFVNPPKFSYCKYLFHGTAIGKNTNGIIRLYEDLGITVNTLSGAVAIGMFSNNSYIKEFIFPDEEFGSFYAQQLFDTSTNLKIVRNLKSSDLGKMFRFCRGARGVELINCYITTKFESDGCGEITKLTNCTIPSNITNIDRFFTGMNIQNDIDIPPHVTSCVETFKNCTKMTNIHANWNNTYTDGITSTDCYSGCTGIEYIDGESVVLYPGDNSLDYIPKEWGGFGLVGEYTSVFEINIPSDNYEVRFCKTGMGFIYSSPISDRYYSENNTISWGDGSYLTKDDILNDPNYDSSKGGIPRFMNMGFPAHTYAKAGTYYVKGNFTSNGYGYNTSCITKCFQLACKWDFGGYITNYSWEFNNFGNLTYVNLSNIKNNPVVNMSTLFNGCSSLTLDNIIGLNNLNLSNVTSMSSMFNGCTKITQLPFTTIPDNVTNIDNIFKNTGITDISGLTIGSGVTSATDWITGSNITTANNVTIKNSVVKFKDCTTLTTCLKLDVSNVTGMEHFFSGCSSLTNISLYPPSSVCDMTRLCYKCSKLINIEYLGSNKMRPISMNDGFREIGKQFNYEFTSDNWDFSNCTRFVYVFYGTTGININMRGASLTALSAVTQPFYASNVDFTGSTFNFTHAVNYNSEAFFASIANLILDNCTISGNLNKQFKYRDGVGEIITISMNNLTLLDDLSKDWSNMFYNCIKLTSDVIIPSSVTNCTNTFKNCTKMTHIHSNWNNTYDNEITSTDCYSGCTGITHIDDVNVITYEGKEGLDEVPEAWGGYEFTKEDTCVLEVVTTESNYRVDLTYTLNNTTDYITSWGDGTVDTLYYHTYTSPGKYIIKTKYSAIFTNGSAVNMHSVLTKVLQMRKILASNSFCFRGCEKLYYLNIDNCIIENNTLLYDNPSLAYISANNLKFKSYAAKSPFVTGRGYGYGEDVTEVEIIGVETWDVSNFINFNSLFKGAKITSLDLSNWDTSKATNMNQLFNGCTSLTSVNMSGWQFNNGCSISSMFNSTSNLKTIIGHENWNLSNTTDCALLFYNSGIEELNVTNWNLSGKGTSVNGVFQNSKLSNLIGSENLINSTWTQLPSIFLGCPLTSIDVSNWNTSNVTSMAQMFQNCKNLQTVVGLENLDMSKVTEFTGMFNECAALTEINLPTTNFNGNNINISTFAQGTKSLTTLDLTSWTNATVTGDLNRFLNYSGVTSFDVSTIDAAVEHLGYSLPKSDSLQEFKYFKSLRFTNIANYNPFTNFSLVECINLSKASLVNFLQVLPDISSSGKSYAIPLGSTNSAKLTSSEIAIATNKGYTIA